MDVHTRDEAGAPAIRLAQLYKALSHPVRLYLLRVLMQQEACVCHLSCVLRRPQPYVSQQLGVLRDAGLVSDRRDGQIVYYRATDAALAELIRLGQALLERQGAVAELPALPPPVVVDCHCPQCEAQRAGGAK